MFIKYIFILSALFLAGMTAFYKLFLQKKQRTENIVKYTHVLIWIFGFYILSAFLLVFSIDGLINKSAAALFAVSPFIIGKFAVYKKETLFSIIQILCALISAVYFCLQ